MILSDSIDTAVVVDSYRRMAGGEKPVSPVLPICYKCKHRTAGLTCTAYPDGIPAAIVNSAVDHRKPYAGDGGVQFEPVDAEAAEYAATVFAPSAAPTAPPPASKDGLRALAKKVGAKAGGA